MKKVKNDEYQVEDLRNYMAIPVKQKLALLEDRMIFFQRFMSVKSKKIWQKLKEKGF